LLNKPKARIRKKTKQNKDCFHHARQLNFKAMATPMMDHKEKIPCDEC